MKKVLVVAVAILGLVVTGTEKAAAQTTPNKFGYFDLEYVLSVMPGIEKVDSLLQIFERDSLNPEYKFELDELNRMDSALKADSAKMPAGLYKQRQQEQIQRYYKLQNWQQYSQQMMQSKQQELMAPYLNKVLEAFQAVIAEHKYTYIFKRETLWQAPPADNLIPLVAKKLGIKLPVDPNAPENAPATKPATPPVKKP
ncbi:MAG TPA: OmpH family outer membrane protein [Phnomibacter sp.]|nr:OmpH family outer membrane protein [Phnomibacter sp.]